MKNLVAMFLVAGALAAPVRADNERSEKDAPDKAAVMWAKDAPREASNRQARAGVNLIYRNGSTLTSTVTAAIFWGASWSNYNGDKITGLDAWYSNVHGTPYARTSDEYSGITSSIAYSGHYIDTSAAPGGAPKTSTIQGEVCRVIGNAVQANAYYPVYVDTPRGAAGYCAWHSWGSCGGTPIEFGFFFNLDGDGGCNPGDNMTLTGHSQGLAALANVTGHELSETRTDPRGSGWVDSSKEENADKCAWAFGSPYVTFSDGSRWRMQGNWSNAAYNGSSGYSNTSGQKGCLDGGNFQPVAP